MQTFLKTLLANTFSCQCCAHAHELKLKKLEVHLTYQSKSTAEDKLLKIVLPKMPETAKREQCKDLVRFFIASSPLNWKNQILKKHERWGQSHSFPQCGNAVKQVYMKQKRISREFKCFSLRSLLCFVLNGRPSSL